MENKQKNAFYSAFELKGINLAETELLEEEVKGEGESMPAMKAHQSVVLMETPAANAGRKLIAAFCNYGAARIQACLMRWKRRSCACWKLRVSSKDKNSLVAGSGSRTGAGLTGLGAARSRVSVVTGLTALTSGPGCVVETPLWVRGATRR